MFYVLIYTDLGHYKFIVVVTANLRIIQFLIYIFRQESFWIKEFLKSILTLGSICTIFEKFGTFGRSSKIFKLKKINKKIRHVDP